MEEVSNTSGLISGQFQTSGSGLPPFLEYGGMFFLTSSRPGINREWGCDLASGFLKVSSKKQMLPPD